MCRRSADSWTEWVGVRNLLQSRKVIRTLVLYIMVNLRIWAHLFICWTYSV